jgi:hypothetical protein
MVDSLGGAGRGEVTWSYADGSLAFGSFQDFEEERDLALTMEESRGHRLAETYYARTGFSLKEMPIERAVVRERLARLRSS